MVSSGIIFFVALVLYLVLYSLSGSYTFIATMLPVLKWVAVALGVVFVIFIIITLFKAIFK